MSQIGFPLHLVSDAQGPIGIMDANNRPVIWCSDLFKPTKDYVWNFPYNERTEVIESIMALLNLRRNIEIER